MKRRSFLAAAAAASLAFPVVSTEAGDPPLFGEDYATARTRFRTKLLQPGPAPDSGDPLTPPAGARRIAYRSGALELTAWLSAEDRGGVQGERPAILFLHGGNALWHGHWDLVKPYRDRGYVAMMPALRAENGQPGFFSGFYDETDDVVAAANALRNLPGVDPTRVFLAGHSVGGTLALLAAMTAPVFRAAAAFSPNPDARAFFERFPEDVRFDAADPREFTMRSAVSFAASFKCPVLMLHGSTETRTEAAIRLTAERARRARLNVAHAIVPGDHTSAIPGETVASLRFFDDLP